LAETLSAMADPDRFAHRASSTVLSALMPFSGAVRQTERIIDPTLTEARTVMDRLLSQIPGASDTLPPYRDLYGNAYAPSGVYGPVGAATLKDEPELKALVGLEVKAPQVPPALESSGELVPLTPEQRDYWAVKRGTMAVDGKTLREALREEMAGPDFRDSSKTSRAFLLDRVLRRYHEAARQAVLDKWPDLRREMEAAMDARIKNLDAPAAPSTDQLTPLLRSLGR
jgi:hypothetical protein